MEDPDRPLSHCEFRCLELDALIQAFASVSVGRQLSRASILAGILAPVFAPLAAYFFMQPMTGMAPGPFSIWASFLIPVSGLVLGLFLYRRLYMGSRRLLSFIASKPLWRIVMFCMYASMLLPIVFLWYVPAEPLLLLYVAALILRLVILAAFTRWARTCAFNLADAHRRFFAEIFYSPLGGKTFSFMWREVLSLPPGYLISRRKVIKISLLSIAALALEGLAVSYIVQQSQVFDFARLHLRDMAALTAKTTDSRADLVTLAVVTAIFPFLSIPIFVISGRLRRAARRAAVNSVSDVRTRDKRAPLVFLRSFSDDQVTLSQSTTGLFQRALVGGAVFSNVDVLLTERYWHVGPVFAIGKPGDSLPPLGAAREYLMGKGWQGVVDGLMKEARAVVLTVDQTEGVLWELSHAHDAGLLEKILILVPPHRHGDIQLIGAVLAVLGIERERLAAIGAERVIALLRVSGSQTLVLCANRTDSYAYDLVLRLGMQVILGGDQYPLGGIQQTVEETVAVLVGVSRLMKGERFPVDNAVFNIGAAVDNNLVVKHDEYVSAHHACFRYEKGRLSIADLRSRNGTFVNERRVGDAPLTVNVGDRIRMGKSIFEVARPEG